MAKQKKENKGKEEKMEETKGLELAEDFDEDEFKAPQRRIVDGQEITVKLYKDRYKQKGSIARGKLRTAEAFNITVEHLEAVMSKLNGRKVDGVFINDLIGRHGFFDGSTTSRKTLAEKTGKSVSQIELAIERLKTIIKRKDFTQAYIEYLDFEEKLKKAAKEEDLRGGSL
jgi:ribosomal protein S25